MFVYEADDYVSEQISIKGKWESNETESFFLALIFYKNKKNISKNDIYILDIGGNIGWYSLILGKKGYNILSFEPSKINYYILLKNYCLNKEINLTITNKGLDNIEKNGSLYHHLKNIGNALKYINNYVLNKNIKDYEIEEIKLCKLNDYIEFLKSQNVALIKLDIEGYEGKAIESGIDLIFLWNGLLHY